MATLNVISPIPGIVKEILVKVGDSVVAEQEVAIIESMKVEIPVESPHAGRVVEICVDLGAAVDEGAVLLRVEG